MTRKFVDEVVEPRAEEMEKTGEYPYDIMDQMADLGMMGIPFPEKYGGSGGDWVGMHPDFPKNYNYVYLIFLIL